MIIASVAALTFCKKPDFRDLKQKPAIENTTVFGKGNFKTIGPRVFEDKKPLADTIKKDSAPMLPSKPKTIVDAPDAARSE